MGSPWKAIADDSRRQVLVLLRDGERTPGEMAEFFDFTAPALSTHLRVLKDAGLVTEHREGKNRLYSVNRTAVYDLVRFFDDFWDDGLHRLKEHVEEKSRKEE